MRPEPLEPLEPRRGLRSVSLGGADDLDEGEERKNNDRRPFASDSSTSTRARAALHPPPSASASSTASIASASACDGGVLECTTNRVTNRVNTGGGGALVNECCGVRLQRMYRVNVVVAITTALLVSGLEVSFMNTASMVAAVLVVWASARLAAWANVLDL